MKRMRNVFMLVVLLILIVTGRAPVAAPVVAQETSVSPNIVLILTDDQDLLLGSMEALPLTRSLIGDQGMVLENFVVPNPLCCPARASLLRGQHAHNTQILYNTPPSGGFQRFLELGHENATVATALHGAGYRTALMGKYLNAYPDPDDPTHIPPGWDYWWAPITDSAYSSYNYTVNDNGTLVTYGSQPQDYITDVIAGNAASFITTTTTMHPGSPFFMFVSVYAPHSPFTPAPRHTSLFPDAQVPRTPGFNESDMSDKPVWMQTFPPLTEADIQGFDRDQRKRMQMLAAVDELVAQVIQTLDTQGVLDNTYVVFTSDNGYHMGQHRFVAGKGTPYEEDTHVPFMVRGPGVPAGVVRNEVAAIIDLTPTFADIAGGALGVPSDGRSMLPLWHTTGPVPWRTGMLLEHWQPPPTAQLDSRLALEPPDPFDLQLQALNLEDPDYRAIRTTDYKYLARPGTLRALRYGQRSVRDLQPVQRRHAGLQNGAPELADGFVCLRWQFVSGRRLAASPGLEPALQPRRHGPRRAGQCGGHRPGGRLLGTAGDRRLWRPQRPGLRRRHRCSGRPEGGRQLQRVVRCHCREFHRKRPVAYNSVRLSK